MEDEKKNRNILEIQLNKVTNLTDKSDSETDVIKVKNLTYEDLGELMFEVLEIDPSDCLAFNFSTGRYNYREIRFQQV